MLALALVAALAAVAGEDLSYFPADCVDTRLGSKCGAGSCMVGPCLPHASVYPSPDGVWPLAGQSSPAPNGWYGTEPVAGFSMLHTQGTGGVPSYGNFRVTFGEPSEIEIYESHPYRFRCLLKRQQIEVGIVPTANGALFTYTGGDPDIDYRCKIGREVASTNAWVGHQGGEKILGGGTYFGNWNPAPYDCYFYALKSPGELRVAVSFKSVGEAKRFLCDELEGRSAEELATAARNEWNAKLGSIRLEGEDAAELRRFYTHLFHAFVQPRRRGDTWDDHYTLWDTWKTLFPLMVLVDPATVSGCVNSFAARQRDYGKCETGFIQGKEMRLGQGGDEADNIIADALLKGVPGIDREGAWEVLAAHAAKRTAHYRECGYVAADAPHDYCWRFKSGSGTLGFAYNDACAARVARLLGKGAAAAALESRSHSWTNVWCAALRDRGGLAGFVRARNVDGSWGAPDEQFDPRTGYNTSFYEGTSWDYSFNVWHDLERLIELCGGKDAFLARLRYAMENDLVDFSNEPGFYTPALAALAGDAALTREYAAKALAAFPPDGTPGDDDSGAMGSYYVFLKLGFLPIAGSDVYVATGTRLKRAVLTLASGREVVFAAERELPAVFHHAELFGEGEGK